MPTVLVTGGAGFIGAHLTAALAARGNEVVVLDNLRRGRRDKVARLVDRGQVRFIEDDIRRFDAVAEAVRGCEVVYHLAAQSNVMGAMTDPDYSVTTNVLGTFNVLRSASEARVPKVVFTSSREVYGDARTLPVSEHEPLLAKNAYGASKVAGEAYCRAFSSANGLRAEVVRLANVYGSGDHDRVIPVWLQAAREGRDLVVYGGEQVIDFLWVGTAVEALLRAGDTGLPGPVNIGSGVGTKILDLAERVLQVTGGRSRVTRVEARQAEVARFVTDTALMRSIGLVPEDDPLAHLSELASAH